MYTISQIGVLLLLLFLYPSYLYETYDGIDPNDDDVEDDRFSVCGLYQHLQVFCYTYVLSYCCDNIQECVIDYISFFAALHSRFILLYFDIIFET